jgi:hypothetical protein
MTTITNNTYHATINKRQLYSLSKSKETHVESVQTLLSLDFYNVVFTSCLSKMEIKEKFGINLQ